MSTGIILTFALLAVAIVVIAFTFIHFGDSAMSDYEEFMASTRLRGMTYREAMDEWRVREELARIRREASDAIANDATKWLDAIARAIEGAADRLATDRPDLAVVLVNTVKSLNYGDLLYPREARKVDHIVDSGTAMTRDMRAAIRRAR